MRRFLTIALLATTLYIGPGAYATSFNVGANLWYAWFEPSFENEFNGKEELQNYDNHFKMTKPAVPVYGALFGIQFDNRFSLGTVFSYGTGYKCESDYKYYNPLAPSAAKIVEMHREMTNSKRFESDITLNYALDNIFKIFIGWKYLGERGEGTWSGYDLVVTAWAPNGEFKASSDYTGPGVGGTSTIHLVDNFYLITTLSGIYLRSRTTSEVSGDADWKREKKENYYGGNAAMNLAYLIPDTGVTLSAGGRYQYLKEFNTPNTNKFYGVMISAIYGFNI